MSAKKGGLGRNLSALLGNNANANPLHSIATETERTKLAIDTLRPGKYQPRGDIEELALLELAESIKKQGLLQPLVVREIDPGRYEIIAGERRWRACQSIGMTEVPVVIRQVDDETAMAIALVENLQREDLNAMDQARAMHRLTTEFALTHQQVAELLSKSRAAVSNYLRLLNLSSDVRRMLENGDFEMGHARALLILEEEQQNHIAKLIVAKNLSVRETEALVARVKSGAALDTTPIVRKETNPLFSEKIKTVAAQLQTKIQLKEGRAGKGSLVIQYHDNASLEKLLKRLEANSVS